MLWDFKEKYLVKKNELANITCNSELGEVPVEDPSTGIHQTDGQATAKSHCTKITKCNFNPSI